MKKILPLAFTICAISTSLVIGCVRKAEEDTAAAPSQSQPDTKVSSDLSKTQIAYITDTQASILARYTQAYNQALALQSAILGQCQSGNVSPEQLQSLRQEWITLAKLWAQAEIINFGIVNEDMRNLYINYYPDNRNVGKKELDALLSANISIDKASLKNESAIIQGLSGLEILFFTHDDLGEAKCSYAIANTDLLTQHINEIVNAWQPNSELTSSLTLDTWINSMLAMLELTKTNAIQKPFGILGKPTGHVPARYAGESKALLVAKLDTLSQATDNEHFKALIDEKAPNSSIYTDLVKAIQTTKEQLQQMPKDLSLATDADKDALSEQFSHLIQLFKRHLMPSLGVQVGFNTSDGD